MKLYFQGGLCSEQVAGVTPYGALAIAGEQPDVQPRGPLSVYAVLLSSVGRQRLCTPLRSLLARGDGQ